MKKTFLFMTGAHQYRLQATSWQEAFDFIVQELNPSADALSIIRSTLREDGDTRWLLKAQDETAHEQVEERRAVAR